MNVQHQAGPRFEKHYESASSNDLLTVTLLTPDQRFAVLLGGISALPLSEDRLVKEWSTLLKEGCPPELAEDTLVQMAAYIGFPRARLCLACLGKSFVASGLPIEVAELEVPTASNDMRHERGVVDYRLLNAQALDNINAAFAELAGNVIESTFRAFGDVYAGSGQPLKLRQFATISALAVSGCAAPQLRFHIGAGMNVGVTKEEIVEIIAWVQFLAGAPAAYNALGELKAALAAGPAATPGYQ